MMRTQHLSIARAFAVVIAAHMCICIQSAELKYTVAYASFAPANSAVFIANSDGTNARTLIDNPALDANPSFSPDGEWVLFTSRRNGSADVYRVNQNGENLERLTDDPAFDDQAVMSPDGKQVAFVSSRSGQADVWILAE